MLTQIHIRDLATIEALQLAIPPLCTMITGETGAGKSIFLEAIELALGARGTANIIRPGKDRADISLCFDLTRFPQAIAWLKNNDLHQDGDECIIRRVMTQDGRSRSYINGLPATQQLVRELGELVFHLHGQYEQQVLFKAENQRDMLDRYAEHLPLAQAVHEKADTWKRLHRDMILLREKTQERAQRSEYLRFQIEELAALQCLPGEWLALEAEHHKLTHSDELLRNIQCAVQQLSGDDHRNALSLLNDIRKSLEAAQNVDRKASEWVNTLNVVHIQLSDLEAELRDYIDSNEQDPERLEMVEQRVSQMFDLARKHKIQPQDLPAFLEHLQNELNGLDASDSALGALIEQQKNIEAEYRSLAAKLSKSRAKAAVSLAKTITKTIRSLSLPHAEFHISLETENNDVSPHGQEKIIFMIKTNPDQTLQPLAKAISGGELSRLSLAAHLALAHVTSTPTLIFDEVDTGVGGATAEKIGKLLRELGESYQVFCVTHQAQVAVCGHQHLFVEKSFIDNTTHTQLCFLNAADKASEIARMLSGEKITEKTLAHAQEMLEAWR